MRALELTEEQEQPVARRSEPLLLSAGAGSGKTSVLVERFVRAVREDRVAPASILAITFTERAAGELRERVRARLLELGEREAARDTEAAHVGTFHGFCARLLREHARAAGLDPGFRILDEGVSGTLREAAFARALQRLLADGRSAAVDLLAAYGHERLHAMVAGAYAALRSRGELAPRLPLARTCGGEHDDAAAAACALIDELLGAFGDAYEQLKRERAALDFDDLELHAGALLARHEGVARACAERYALLMVDEFQDTNPRQLAILRALDRGNLFTVGDEFQSIYLFRHADVRLFRERRGELEAHARTLALTRNFRSRPELLGVVNAVFEQRFAGFQTLIAARNGTADVEQPGPAVEQPGPAVELLLTDTRGWEEHPQLAQRIAAGLPRAPLWRQAEAQLLAERVAELVREGHARAGEIVVLLRAAGDLEVYERALALRGLRTLASLGGFWAQQQVRDLLAYLRALANPLDELALYEALASPLGGCSSDTLALLAEAARERGESAWQTALACEREPPLLAQLPASQRRALLGLCGLLARERARAAQRTISQLLERAIDARSYREHVLTLDWAERRLANVYKLLRVARRFQESEGRELRGFLDHAERLSQARNAEPDAPLEDAEPDAVRLMTVHAAKGLEFPVVCLADLGRAPNNRMPDLLVDGERVGLRLMRLDGEPATPALDFEELEAARARAEAEEEQRIVYVAMTRARERLLLSGALAFDRPPEPGPSASSISWLAPALAGELPPLDAGSVPAALDVRVARSPAALVRVRLSSPAAARQLGLERLAEERRDPAPAAPAPGHQLELDLQGGPALAAADAAPRPDAATVPIDPPGGAAAVPIESPPGATAVPIDPAAPVSYSSLAELERCGYRYYLERVLALAEVPAPGELPGRGLDARARGTLVHALLERVPLSPAGAPSAQDVAREARALGLRTTAEEREQIAALLARACSSPLAARVAAAESVRREHPFAFALDETLPLLTGVIDLLAREPDGTMLVLDYKTDALDANADLEPLVQRDYELQRLLYALAVLRSGARRVEVVHWFLQRPHEHAAASFREGDRAPLEERLRARLHAAAAAGFAVSPAPHRGLCATCPGRAQLCSWSERETLRETPAR